MAPTITSPTLSYDEWIEHRDQVSARLVDLLGSNVEAKRLANMAMLNAVGRCPIKPHSDWKAKSEYGTDLRVGVEPTRFRSLVVDVVDDSVAYLTPDVARSKAAALIACADHAETTVDA